MVERFDGKIKQVIITARFKNTEELLETLMTYLHTYNHLLPQRVSNGKTPIETLSEYYKSHPQIFKTNPANLTEPDSGSGMFGLRRLLQRKIFGGLLP